MLAGRGRLAAVAAPRQRQQLTAVEAQWQRQHPALALSLSSAATAWVHRSIAALAGLLPVLPSAT